MDLRTKLSLAAFASLALFACGTSTSDGPVDDDVVDSEESEVRACSDVYARKFFVTLDARSCADVPAHRGTWIAKPLEAGESDSVCTMEWKGEKYSRADVDALRAFVKQTDAMTAACGSRSAPDVGYLTPIPQVDVVGMIGANGCDVCGKLRRDGKIIVVLPPYRTSLRQFAVTLSDGSSRSFQINAAEGARAVSLQLPPPPAGTTYVAAPVMIY